MAGERCTLGSFPDPRRRANAFGGGDQLFRRIERDGEFVAGDSEPLIACPESTTWAEQTAGEKSDIDETYAATEKRASCDHMPEFINVGHWRLRQAIEQGEHSLTVLE